MNVTFDSSAVGKYTQDDVASDFGRSENWNNGLDEGRATIVSESGQKFLRITYVGGKYGPSDGGVQFNVPFGKSYNELYFSYRVRFAADFDFVKGGKLPGLIGGSSPSGCVSDVDGFSARNMFRSGGAAVQYMYWPDKENSCGDDFAYLSGQTAVKFKPGTWHLIEHRVVMNSVGARNGVMQAWFDGKSVLNRSDLRYRISGQSFGIDGITFSTFFGGSDSSWAPKKAQVADFDDFRTSTKPISH